ncbi:hypothetical protein NIES23_42220 [Trichormus variabilis NIES-23]|uniref:Uncharacterized protein n=1 Tax=Trichormus variabilis NIES-23 TaxID=1973479 RepID=A0A1Z4KR08_ANAVA|nr:hypothetical protein NIES23_42220 [Trichormus variabilis NIES-23]
MAFKFSSHGLVYLSPLLPKFARRETLLATSLPAPLPLPNPQFNSEYSIIWRIINYLALPVLLYKARLFSIYQDLRYKSAPNSSASVVYQTYVRATLHQGNFGTKFIYIFMQPRLSEHDLLLKSRLPKSIKS